jgi:hypothetical protein
MRSVSGEPDGDGDWPLATVSRTEDVVIEEEQESEEEFGEGFLGGVWSTEYLMKRSRDGGGGGGGGGSRS